MVETVVVRETVEVEVEVEKTVEVEKIVEQPVEVEVEKVVTATPGPVEPETITYFTFSAAPDHLEDLDRMIEIFEAANPQYQRRGGDGAFRRLLHQAADPYCRWRSA